MPSRWTFHWLRIRPSPPRRQHSSRPPRRYSGEVAERNLPPQYAGWEALEREARRMSTADLVHEIEDGAPERRLAALSAIDLSSVDRGTIEDWIRTLPDAEVNELAGAIPALRHAASCRELIKWAGVARFGYDRRRTPTFLVMLFSCLEGLEARNCAEAPTAWERAADWLAGVSDALAAAGDHGAFEDLSLFVFEIYLDRVPIFEAFCATVARHQQFALKVSANPAA